jgi:hypothetical protein
MAATMLTPHTSPNAATTACKKGTESKSIGEGTRGRLLRCRRYSTRGGSRKTIHRACGATSRRVGIGCVGPEGSSLLSGSTSGSKTKGDLAASSERAHMTRYYAPVPNASCGLRYFQMRGVQGRASRCEIATADIGREAIFRQPFGRGKRVADNLVHRAPRKLCPRHRTSRKIIPLTV